MDEKKATKPKKTSRSRQPSVASPSGSPKSNDTEKNKSIRSRKVKKSIDSESGSVNDFDDAASSKSSNSSNMQSCAVNLTSARFKQLETEDRAIAQSTRSRRNSKLTEENLAALVASPQRSLRSGSVLSDKTVDSAAIRTRSTRLNATQNTPSKEPARRKSRLLSENDKAVVDSPAKPARRNLRSNSTISEDVSPPTRSTRGSSRITDAQSATPSKALKTKVSQIKADPATPRRGSGRFNKSVLTSDIIDEEPSDNDEEPAKKKVSKSKEHRKSNHQVLESGTETKSSDDKENQNESDKPNEEDVRSLINNSESLDVAKSPKSLPKEISKRRSIVLVETNTMALSNVAEKTLVSEDQLNDPVEPMETSVVNKAASVADENVTERTASTVDDVKTPKTKSPRSKLVEPINLDTTANEIVASPAQSKSKENDDTKVADMEKSAEVKNINPDESSEKEECEEMSKVSKVKPRISSNFEPMDVSDHEDDDQNDANNSIKEILKTYGNKNIQTVAGHSVSTPKISKSRPSFSAFKDMNVSVLAHEADTDPIAQPTKDSPRRLTPKTKLNNAVEKSDDEIDEKNESMEVSRGKMDDEDLPAGSSNIEKEMEVIKLVTPKSTQMEKMKSPKPSSQTPQKQPTKNVNSPSPSPHGRTISHKSSPSKMAKSPRNTSFGNETSMNMNLEIDKLLEGLSTPGLTKEDGESQFSRIFKNTTPISAQQIDQHFDAIAAESTEAAEATEATEIEPKITQTNSTDDDEAQQNIIAATEVSQVIEDQKENSTCNKEPGYTSVINASQSDLDESKPSTSVQHETLAVSEIKKSDRKSVQIVTPKMDKTQSLAKRMDTPYPNEKSILEASAKLEENEERLKEEKEKRANAREELTKLRDSWSKSLKRISNEGLNAIDSLGAADQNKTAEPNAPSKQFVPARNNWAVSKGLVDSDSESEHDIVPETEVESGDESDTEDGANGGNEFVANEAEEVGSDYNSGDSMDEEERHEIEENTIDERGEDLGSEDTDNDDDEVDEYEEEEYESDGFIVNDDDHVSVDSSHDVDENIDDDALVQPKRRRSRIILQSSSDESDSDENSNDTTTGVVLIPFEQVEVSVAVEVNANVGVELAVEQFVEGKKFPTTFLVQDDEKNVEKTTNVAKIDKPEPSTAPSTEQNTGQSIELRIEPVFEVSSNQSKPEEVEEVMDVTVDDVPTQSDGPNESMANEERIEKDVSFTTTVIETATQSDEPNVSVTKREDVEKDATIEQASVKVPSQNSNKANESIAQTENIEISVEPDSVSPRPNDSVNSNASDHVPLNISSQEENNNRKIGKGAIQKSPNSAKVTTHAAEVKDQSSKMHEADIPTTSENNVVKLKKKNSKRRFEEIDTDNEQNERPKLKVLKAVTTASGFFLEEPRTPEKTRHGFNVTPLTPVNPRFNVFGQEPVLERPKGNKRKSIYLDEEEVSQMLLPKPRWLINTQFEKERPAKRARKLDMGSTEVIFQPLQPKKKKYIPRELLEFRSNRMYRQEIPRQDARALLREKRLRKTNHK